LSPSSLEELLGLLGLLLLLSLTTASAAATTEDAGAEHSPRLPRLPPSMRRLLLLPVMQARGRILDSPRRAMPAAAAMINPLAMRWMDGMMMLASSCWILQPKRGRPVMIAGLE